MFISSLKLWLISRENLIAPLPMLNPLSLIPSTPITQPQVSLATHPKPISRGGLSSAQATSTFLEIADLLKMALAGTKPKKTKLISWQTRTNQSRYQSTCSRYWTNINIILNSLSNKIKTRITYPRSSRIRNKSNILSFFQ